MSPVLNGKAPPAKSFVRLALAALLLAGRAQAHSEERPFLKSSLDEVLSFGASPSRLRLVDLAWLAPSAAALGILANNDVPLYHAMTTDQARAPWLDHSMPAVSALGDGLLEFSAAALMSKLGNERLARTSAEAMQGLLVVAVYASVLKTAAWSNRPSQDDQAHRYWAFDQSSQGMPSGHSFSAFCVAEVYGSEYGRYWTYPLACLVAYSRIYNQAHWPSDVFAGALLGVCAGVQVRHSAEAKGAPAIHFSLSPISQSPGAMAYAQF